MRRFTVAAPVRGRFAALLAVWLCLCCVPAAWAQDSTAAEPAATAETLRELSAEERTGLVARLSDEQIRGLFL
jgi:hypothetical protein